jgi:DNA-directed RNA polymerase specialized sigma subunit
MRIAEQSPARTGGDWADQTRRVLTRDLLLRAARAQPAESHALQFRALHLNLPLVGEVAEGLGLAEETRLSVEHAALDGLLQAMRVFDPYGADEFADFALPFVEQRIISQLSTARPPSSRRERPVRPLPRRGLLSPRTGRRARR